MQKTVKMLAFVGILAGGLAAFSAQAANRLVSLDAAQDGQNVLLKLNFSEPLAAQPTSFSVDNPPRIALDFPGFENGLGKATQDVALGDVVRTNIVEAGEKMRVVVNLARPLHQEMRVEGNSVLLTLLPVSGVAQAEAASPAADVAAQRFVAEQAVRPHALRDISFRRGRDGEGRVIVDLADEGGGIDIRQQGNTLVVDFLKTALPDALRRKLNVDDFATPVSSITTEAKGQNVQMKIAPNPKSHWEHTAWQAGNQFVIEIRPVVEDPNKLVQGSKIGYQGPRISINYQNGDERALLRLMAEELGLNAVISDTVSGTTTLVLKDVPADQVIDIIFQQQGLDMRKSGNVIMIAPRDEIATREKLAYESRQSIEDLEPMRTETFQINYQKADAIIKLLTDENQRVLSKRGSAVMDQRTNQVFIQDIGSRLENVRQIISKVDVPVRQVMIEARIVEASDGFARNLGVRLGLFNSINGGQNWVSGGSNNQNLYDAFTRATSRGKGQYGSPYSPDYSSSSGDGTSGGSSSATYETEEDTYLDNLPQVNMQAQSFNGVNPSNFSFVFFNSAMTRFLNLEISALEADLKGKVVSAPRVMTSDQTEAVIEQGVEIPYLEASSSGATSVGFKKAMLALKVTPHITPDGKVSMKIEVSKDSRGTDTIAGPAINSRHVTTDVLVDNGGTVVIGGIYEQTERNDVDKVPFLGDIPILGYAFKRKTNTNEKTELLVFITPRIVNEAVAQMN
ncbi:MAG: type IV pilus secretin PilQ [Zoogloeaceae bacterium]|jgi:type IV pilus assembly protein PilQ|nr:type IV pilus secretin PilQ [Zoogloeaceae bacterium]